MSKASGATGGLGELAETMRKGARGEIWGSAMNDGCLSSSFNEKNNLERAFRRHCFLRSMIWMLILGPPGGTCIETVTTCRVRRARHIAAVVAPAPIEVIAIAQTCAISFQTHVEVGYEEGLFLLSLISLVFAGLGSV